ncbi:hypothetical protein ABZ137_22540 [Streptomyces bobili]|uniref:hypothetical protein n=1 Tax=Streptomyces bobili TaxID=67280 RepID=UPI0033BEF055
MTPASSRSSAAGRRPGDDSFRCERHRGTPPGAELLGDLTDLVVAEPGSGAGHRAARLAHTGRPARIVAVDHDVHRTAEARAHYGHLPLLHLVDGRGRPPERASARVRRRPQRFRRAGLRRPAPPAARRRPRVRPGGLLAFSTLAPTPGTRRGRPRAAARPRTPRPGTSSWTGTAST